MFFYLRKTLRDPKLLDHHETIQRIIDGDVRTKNIEKLGPQVAPERSTSPDTDFEDNKNLQSETSSEVPFSE